VSSAPRSTCSCCSGRGDISTRSLGEHGLLHADHIERLRRCHSWLGA
jgi:hypothetical protein